KLLIQAAACNLALLMRSMYGAGKPRAAHNQAVEVILAILALTKSYPAFRAHGVRTLAICRVRRIASHKGRHSTGHPKIGRFRHRLLSLVGARIALIPANCPVEFADAVGAELRDSMFQAVLLVFARAERALDEKVRALREGLGVFGEFAECDYAVPLGAAL